MNIHLRILFLFIWLPMGSLYAQLTVPALQYNFSSNFVDSSGFNREGIPFGGAFVPDRAGNANAAYDLSRIGEYIEAINSETLTLEEALTISVWVLPKASKGGVVLSKIYNKGFSVSGYGLSLNSNGTFHLTLSQKKDFSYYQNYSSKSILDTTAWSHIVITFDLASNNLKLYVNGVLDTLYKRNQAISPNPYPVVLGQQSMSANGPNFIPSAVRIDDVRLYSVALTDTEIRTLYQTCPVTRPTLITRIATDSLAAPVLGKGSRFAWFKDGNRLPDSTQNIKTRQEGIYTLRTTDTRGCMSQLSHGLYVQPKPCYTPPINIIRVATDSLMIDGLGRKYQWRKNGVVMPDTSRIIKANWFGVYAAKMVDSAGCYTDLAEFTLAYKACVPPASPIITLVGADSLRVSATAYSYQWRKDGILLADSAQQIKARGVGVYTVKTISQSGCFSRLSEAYIHLPASLVTVAGTQATIRLYPNPSTGVCTLESLLPFTYATITVCNLSGQIVHTQDHVDLSTRIGIDLSKQPRGIYFLQIQTSTTTQTLKLVLN